MIFQELPPMDDSYNSIGTTFTTDNRPVQITAAQINELIAAIRSLEETIKETAKMWTP